MHYTLSILREVCVKSYLLYIPTEIYDAVMLQPEEKFEKLPMVISDWIENDESIISLSDEQKNEYVRITRQILEFEPQSAGAAIKNRQKIGTESIHLRNVIDKLGPITGKILFEKLAISSERKAKIIAFGRKTISLARLSGISIFEFTSEYKKKVKDKKNIKKYLVFLMFFIGTKIVEQALTPFSVYGFSPSEITTLGILLVGNG